jgi:hypothetical protein
VKKAAIAVGIFMVITLMATPAQAVQEAILTADALVSKYQSSIQEYQRLKKMRKNGSARKLLQSNHVFICPRDTKVEVVNVGGELAKVRLRRLDPDANPISMYFWTLAKQLRLLPQ